LCSREKIHHIDNSLVKDSLNILRLERIRCNHLLVYDKVSNKHVAHLVFVKVLERKSLMCVTWIGFPPYFTMNHKPTHTHSHCPSECLVLNCVCVHFAYHTENFHMFYVSVMCMGQNSIVSIVATYCRLDSLMIEPRLGRDFPHLPRPALGPTQSPVQGVLGLFPRGKVAGAWHWPPPYPLSTEVKERVETLLFFPSGPLRPVLGWTLSLSVMCIVFEPLHKSLQSVTKFWT
jgi:hypothetical protein